MAVAVEPTVTPERLGARSSRALRGVLGSSMTRYILARVVWAVLMLLAVSALTFVIFYTLPSADPAALRAGRQATPQLIAQIRHALGLDRPVYDQFWTYMKNLVLHFNLGYSYENNVSVRSEIFS